MRRKHSLITNIIHGLENAVHWGGWAVPLARAVGGRPRVTAANYALAASSNGPSIPPLRLGYASDFHAGPTTDPEVLRAACAALRTAEPDVVLFGGDFVNFNPNQIEWLAPELASVPAPFGRFAVLGNHDWMADAPRIADHLERVGIQVLTNRNARLSPPFDDVWICGLDDHWCGYPDAGAAFAGADGFRVVLMHAPSGLLDIGDNRFDLALCGHTHGGQIALPGGRALAVPNGALSRRYSRGCYTLPHGETLLVSVGVGCVVFPLRLHADPEITICTVASALSPEGAPRDDASGRRVSSDEVR
ncbi:MAG: metallophosphoesterase [Gemmatimonadales bacterium]